MNKDIIETHRASYKNGSPEWLWAIRSNNPLSSEWLDICFGGCQKWQEEIWRNNPELLPHSFPSKRQELNP